MLGLRAHPRRQTTKLDLVQYSDGIFLGKSPTIRDIETLARKQGIRTLLNLNTEGEPGELLSPNVEASWAHATDLQHDRVSSDVGGLRSEWVDRFLDTLQRVRKPVYVHSLHGRRAATVMIIHLALARGLPAVQALAEARGHGIDCELEPLRRFIATELELRDRARSPGALVGRPDSPAPVGALSGGSPPVQPGERARMGR
jgi:protein tyrosine phosphatase (PTP) superfamily phosphohydrolase (DUF442 family)